MFFWSIVNLIEVVISTLTLYFAYVFLEKKDVPFWSKLIYFFIIGAYAIFLPTRLNITGFDISNCEAGQGPLINFFYAIEILNFLWLIIYLVRKNLRPEEKKLTRAFSIGVILFLASFSGANLIGSVFSLINPDSPDNWKILQYGLFGMPIFMASLAYLIVKFKAFDIKLIGTKVLMYAVIAMIASQFFFIKASTNFVLTGVTLVIVVVLGGLLIKSVEKEVAQREEIENLAKNLAKSNDSLFVANEELKELNKQKTEFVSIASHQLRSPLTAIKGYSSMLLEGSFGPVEEKAKGAIDRIFESSKRLMTVIEDFLNITRIELGKMKYEMSVFDLGQVAQTVVKDQEPNVTKRGLTIEFKDGTNNHQVSADIGKVTQVVSNIIDNSIKYTPSGWIKVSVENFPAGKSKTKEVVRLTVSDSGIGLDPTAIKKLFDKFVRADDAGKTNITGTGLGLYVAKQIVESLGGKIWAESEGKGKGSQFIVEFPRSTSEAIHTEQKIEAYTKADFDKLKKK
jgi:signal transduction histidine kinase